MPGPSSIGPGPLDPDIKPRPLLERVQKFFNHSLIEYQPEPFGAINEIRPLTSFDRHLADDRRLKKVVYLPHLATKLSGLAENTLARYIYEKGPLTSMNGFPNLEVPQGLDTVPQNDKLREAIAVVYKISTFPESCASVAATLEFQQSNWSNHGLKWFTRKAICSKSMADGVLKLVQIPTNLPIYPPPVRYENDMIENYPVIGVWRFEKPVASSFELAQAFVSLCSQDQFSWTGCQYDNDCISHCKNPESKSKHLSTSAPWPIDALEPVGGHMLINIGRPPVESSNIAEVHLNNATIIAQQVYTSMVVADTTYACLALGRYHIFLQRERWSGQMGISRVVDSTEAGYARQLVGLFIAMLRDATQRSQGFREFNMTLREYSKGQTRPAKSRGKRA